MWVLSCKLQGFFKFPASLQDLTRCELEYLRPSSLVSAKLQSTTQLNPSQGSQKQTWLVKQEDNYVHIGLIIFKIFRKFLTIHISIYKKIYIAQQKQQSYLQVCQGTYKFAKEIASLQFSLQSWLEKICLVPFAVQATSLAYKKFLQSGRRRGDLILPC